MAYSFNRIILVGRLTRDPEIRMTTAGDKIANFTIAVDRGYSENKEVDFINIVAFGKRADFSEKYLKKGLLILVEGALRINRWKDNNGNNREKAEIWANTLQFMESKKQNEEVKVEEPIGELPDLEDETFDDMPTFFPVD